MKEEWKCQGEKAEALPFEWWIIWDQPKMCEMKARLLSGVGSSSLNIISDWLRQLFSKGNFKTCHFGFGFQHSLKWSSVAKLLTTFGNKTFFLNKWFLTVLFTVPHTVRCSQSSSFISYSKEKIYFKHFLKSIFLFKQITSSLLTYEAVHTVNGRIIWMHSNQISSDKDEMQRTCC